MSEAEPSGTVRFTVKELLQAIDLKLDTLNNKLDAKAEAQDLMELERRVDTLEGWRNQSRGALAVVMVGITAIVGRLIGLY
jgi:hypothetical protein